jgi:hypothetical protein
MRCGDPATQRGEVAAVATKLGLSITVDALPISGLAFKRAQLLEFDKRPLAQFAYLDPAGVPVAFCATRTSEADSPIRAGFFRGLAAAFWSMNDYGFIVIGAPQRDVAAHRCHFGRTDPGCPACVQRVTRAPLLPERLAAPELVRSPSRRGSKLAARRRFFVADVTAARS